MSEKTTNKNIVKNNCPFIDNGVKFFKMILSNALAISARTHTNNRKVM